ncbi:MAG: toll/interleukin-1 receptor domain-containing protein [Egibacteraceae bacterium]
MSVEGEAGQRDFFVSRAGADRAWAEWIAWQLEETGYTAVVQDWDFAPGENFIGRMRQALDAAGYTIAVLSDAYFRSPYCEDEWTGAFVRDEHGRDRFLPVHVEDCRLPRLVATRVYVDLVGLNAAAPRPGCWTGWPAPAGGGSSRQPRRGFRGRRGRGFRGGRQRSGTCGRGTRTSPGATG